MASTAVSHEQRNWMAGFAVPIQILTTALVGIRIASRMTTKGNLGLDDVFIIVAWILGTALTVLVLLATYKYGFNRHIWDVPPDRWASGALIGFIIEYVFFYSTCLTKISVLMFYRRLVAGTYSNKFKWAMWAAITFVVVYTIVVSFLVLFTCNPIPAVWKNYDLQWAQTHKFSCTSRPVQTWVAELTGALSVFSDVYSILLPAALLMRIRISRRQRIGLLFVFGVGFLVVGSGIARTIFLGRTQAEVLDKSWAAFEVFVTSIAECNVAIMCACAPSLKSVFGRFFRDLSSKVGSRDQTKDSSGNTSRYDSQISNALKRSASMIKRIAPTSRLEVHLQRRDAENSFVDAHEYGLKSLDPVPSGYDDKLAVVTEETHRVISPPPTLAVPDLRNSGSDFFDMRSRFDSIPGLVTPGSFIISPSESSDDEASLVPGNPRDGLPGFLPDIPSANSSAPDIATHGQRPRSASEPPAFDFGIPLSPVTSDPFITSVLRMDEAQSHSPPSPRSQWPFNRSDHTRFHEPRSASAAERPNPFDVAPFEQRPGTADWPYSAAVRAFPERPATASPPPFGMGLQIPRRPSSASSSAGRQRRRLTRDKWSPALSPA